MRMNIYFICTGNTCRSPMAEAILRAKQIEGVSVRSAGIHTEDGIPISSNAQTLMEEANMAYTPHASKVNKDMVEGADLVLTMTQSHRFSLAEAFPQFAEKIFTLKEYVDEIGDVHDPYGGDLQTYRHTFIELTRLIDLLERKWMEDKNE